MVRLVCCVVFVIRVCLGLSVLVFVVGLRFIVVGLVWLVLS